MQKANKDDVYVLVGQRLRALRLEHDMTQAQAAKLIEVSPQQYQKYEDAQTKCSLNAIVTLAGFYGVTVSSIVSPTDVLAASDASTETSAPADGNTLSTLSAGEEDLLSRLVSAYLRLPDQMEKMRVVELLEAIKAAHF